MNISFQWQWRNCWVGCTSFVDLLCFFLCLLCLCARLFICALCSPAGKGLTSWLSFVVSNCDFVTFPLVSWAMCSTLLYRFLIFAPLLSLLGSRLHVLPNQRELTFVFVFSKLLATHCDSECFGPKIIHVLNLEQQRSVIIEV